MPTPIPDPLVAAIVARWPVARLATLAAEGRPHLVPIAFAVCEGALWSPVDGKPKSGGNLARLRNVERDPRVAVLLDRYTADWRLLWWIRVEARASVVRAAGPVEALRAKYPQYGEVPVFRDAPTWLRIAPERTASWYASAAALEELREA